MPNRIKAWLRSQTQTRKFHPIWIVMAVAVTLIVAGIIWIPAMLVSETKPPSASTAPPQPDASGKNRAPPASMPTVIEQTPSPDKIREAKTIRVDFSPPAEEDMPTGEFGGSTPMKGGSRDAFVSA